MLFCELGVNSLIGLNLLGTFHVIVPYNEVFCMLLTFVFLFILKAHVF